MLSLPPEVLTDLSELDAATNERTTAERGGNSAIGPGEYCMVFLKPTSSTLRLPTTVRTAAHFIVRSAVPGTLAWNLKPQLPRWRFTKDTSSKMRD